MRLAAHAVTIAIVAAAATPMRAQTTEPFTRDRVTFDVAGGMSKYGPHAFGGLEVAMNRWLAVRGEALFGVQSPQNWPGYRFTAVAVSGVVSYKEDGRVSPYLSGGYAFSLSQGFEPNVGPLGAAGFRFRFGKVQPFIELRAQHRIGTPISLGLRF